PLAEGGMGAVYSAFDPELDRRLAIKLLHTRTTANGRKRMIRDKVAEALNNLSLVDWALGRYDQATTNLEQALTIHERSLGPGHPMFADSLNNLAGVLFARGRYPEAVAMLERAIAVYEKALGPDHPDLAISFNNLADAQRALGRYPEAMVNFDRALAIWANNLDPGLPLWAYPYTGMGRALVRMHQLDLAKRHLELALSIREKALGLEHPELTETLLGLGELAMTSGRPAQAIPIFERALKLSNKDLRADAQLALAGALLAAGSSPANQARGQTLATEARDFYQRVGHQPGLAEVNKLLGARVQAP
ncbi:MAG: tetratricopeptide repeat-containing serine/threonine-protein kinase, partial [Nitrospira sp.]|nr:tetratricopeptide repeat-containing serine/threonine-protein kinase [Nitrospira sp.]